MNRWLLVWAVGNASAAFAQQTYSLDFVDGGLPSGCVEVDQGQSVGTLLPDGGHYGAPQWSVTDSYSMTQMVRGCTIGCTVSPSVAGSYYGRAWFRLVSSNGQGAFSVLQVTGAADGGSLSLVTVQGEGGVVTQDDAWTEVSNVGIDVGPWHLVEVAVTGVGTASGMRTLWIDGQLGITRSGLDWRNASVTSFTATVSPKVTCR